MKRKICLALCFCLCLCACSSDGAGETETEPARNEVSEETVQETEPYISQAMEKYPLLKEVDLENGLECEGKAAVFDNAESSGYTDSAKGTFSGITVLATLERAETSKEAVEEELDMLVRLETERIGQYEEYSKISVGDTVEKEDGSCLRIISYNLNTDGSDYPSSTVIQVSPMEGGHYSTVQIDIDGSVRATEDNQKTEALNQLSEYYDIGILRELK